VTKALTFLVLFLFAIGGQAQDSDLENRSYKHHFYLNPGALISVPSGIQLGYEYSFSEKLRLDIQGGILVFLEEPNFSDFAAKDRMGMRYQASLKNYFGKSFFIGPMFLFKRVNMIEPMWVDRYENSWSQIIELERKRRTIAMGIELGWQHTLDDSPLLLEISYGLGVQSFKVSYSNVPADSELLGIDGLGVRPGKFLLPFLNHSIKLKYPLYFLSKDSKGESKKKSRRKKKR